MKEQLPPAVVFDLGGVLVRIAYTWQTASVSAGIRTKLPAEPPLYLEGLPGFLEYQVGVWDERRYLETIGAQLGVSPQEALDVHNGILIEPYTGTRRLVEELHGLGIVTGVLSNTNRPHWEILTDPERYPAIARIERRVASHEIGLEKPDPRIFLYTAEAFGLTPRQIVYFDDNPRNVASALSLGWRAHQIDPFGDPASQMRATLLTEGIDVQPASLGTDSVIAG